MRMTKDHSAVSKPCRAPAKALTGETMIAKGKAIDVTRVAIPFFKNERVVVENTVYEQYVEWDSRAMREHGVCLDVHIRLADLLSSAGEAKRHAIPAEFSFRTTQKDGNSSDPCRHSFVLDQIGTGSQPVWLIRN